MADTEDVDFYKNILDNIYDGVYFTDTDRTITYWNEGARRITGYDASEVLGKHCRDNLLVHVDEKGTELCFSDLCPAFKSMRGGGSARPSCSFITGTGTASRSASASRR